MNVIQIAQHPKLSKELTDCAPVASVLAWSQSYMRERKVRLSLQVFLHKVFTFYIALHCIG